LGLVYTPSDNSLKSETRSGRSLPYTFTELIKITNDINRLEYQENPKGNSRTISHARMLNTFLDKLNIPALNYFLTLKGFSSDRLFKRFQRTESHASYNSVLWARDAVHQLRIEILRYTTTLKKSSNTESSLSEGFESVFSGLLMSRLYTGSKVITSFATDSGAQNFKYQCKTGSLGHILRTHYQDRMNLFNGSSVGTYTMVRLVSQRSKPTSGFKLLGNKPILSIHESVS
jgi:hypothetical protein